MDETLFRLVNAGLASPVLDPPMAALSWLFGRGLALPIGLLLVGVYLRARPLLWRVVAALVATSVLVPVAKRFINRPRPAAVLDDVRVVGDQLMAHSFPSGHTAGAFVLAWLVFFLDRRLGVAALAFACVAGLSRVYVGAHWPSDVAASVVLTGLAAWAAVGRPRAKSVPQPQPEPAVSLDGAR